MFQVANDLTPTPLQAFNPPLYRMSVERYHHLIESGFFSEQDRIELLEGIVVQQMPENPPHSTTRSRLGRALDRLVSSRWLVRAQEPIPLTESEPEPDIAVVRGTIDEYALRHPMPADIGLVIEIADATYELDNGWKKAI